MPSTTPTTTPSKLRSLTRPLEPMAEPMDPEESASMDGGLADAFKELAGESLEEEVVEEASPETVAASVDEALGNEDIEALFDD